LGFRVEGLGFRVWGLGFGVGVWDLGFRVWGLGLGLSIEGLGFRVRVEDLWVPTPYTLNPKRIACHDGQDVDLRRARI
jgi:hypothetical protein